MPDQTTAPAPAPVIAYEACDSSQIEAYGYDAATQTLGIKFKPIGSEYHYAGCPPEAFEALKAAESVGRFFGSSIKGKYEFTRQPARKDEADGAALQQA